MTEAEKEQAAARIKAVCPEDWEETFVIKDESFQERLQKFLDWHYPTEVEEISTDCG